MNIIKNVKNIRIYIIIGFYILFAISVFYTPLLHSGNGYATISWDHIFPPDGENFYGRFFYMWNEHEQHSNLQNIITFIPNAPFLLLNEYIIHTDTYTLIAIIRVFFFVVGGVTSYILIRWLLEISIRDVNTKILETSAIIGSVIFTISPIYIVKIQFYIMSSMYQMLPLVFLFLFKYLYTKRLRYLLLMTIFLPVIYSNLRFIFLIPMSVVVIATIYEVITLKFNIKNISTTFNLNGISNLGYKIKYELIPKTKTAGSIYIFTVISFLMFVYVVPYYMFTKYSMIAGIPPYDLGTESILNIRTNTQIVDVLSLHTFWLEDKYSMYSGFSFWIFNFSEDSTKIISLLITLFGLLSIFFIKRLKNKDFFILSAISFAILAFVSSTYSDSILIWTYKQINIFSTMFRDPRDTTMILSLFRSIVVGFAIYLILAFLYDMKTKIGNTVYIGISVMIVAGILTLTLIASYPIFNDFDRMTTPVKISDRFLLMDKYLTEETHNDKIISYPKYRENAKWNYNKDVYMFDDLFITNKNMLVWEGGVIGPSYTMVRRSPLTMYSNWVYWNDERYKPLDVVHLNNSQNIATLFSRMGIKYITLNKNAITGRDIEKDLNIQKGISKVYENKEYNIYNISTKNGMIGNDTFKISPGIVILDDTLDSFDMLRVIGNTDYPILLTDEIPLDYANEIFDWNNTITFSKGNDNKDKSKSIEYHIRNMIGKDQGTDDIIIIKPYKYAESVQSKKDWIKSSTLYENYDKVLRRNGIFDFSQDHLYGVIRATDKNAVIKIPLNIENESNYNIYIRYFQSPKGGKISVNNMDIDTISKDSNYEWAKVSQYIYRGQQLVLENIKGMNFVNTIVVVKKSQDADQSKIYGKISNNIDSIDDYRYKDVKVDVKEYRKIDPTKYELTMYTDRPFVLEFTESYDPLWTAYVNGKEYRSVPLYSSINGFLVNDTGNLNITVVYKPQQWFYYGTFIALTIFAIFMYYIYYDWRRQCEN